MVTNALHLLEDILDVTMAPILAFDGRDGGDVFVVAVSDCSLLIRWVESTYSPRRKPAPGKRRPGRRGTAVGNI